MFLALIFFVAGLVVGWSGPPPAWVTALVNKFKK